MRSVREESVIFCRSDNVYLNDLMNVMGETKKHKNAIL